MKGKILIATAGMALVVGLVVAGCSSGGGETTCEMPTPNLCDGKCQECCTDADCEHGTCNAGVCECEAGFDKKCGAGEMCVECCEDSECDQSICGGDVMCKSGECTPGGILENEDCSMEPYNCCAGLACDVFTNVCVPECSSDSDCNYDVPFADDIKCSGGVCDFQHCTKDANCAPGQVCYNGDCVTIPSCDDIASCSIVPATAVTQQGTQVQFSASAFFASGALAPGVSFEWASSDSNIVAIDANGLATGGANTGSATITASVPNCSVSCTASVQNYGAVQSGSRIVVLSELEQTPIEGATVKAGDEEVTTDAQGVATLTADLSASPADVSIFHPEYHYLTIRQVNTNDVLAHIGKLYQYDFSKNPPEPVAGGIQGELDFSRVRCAEGEVCDVWFGLAGLSIPGNLVNLNFDLLIGGMIKTDLSEFVSGQVVTLPSGLVLCLQGKCAKQYSPTGIPGTRAAWALGGKLNLNELLSLLGPVISGGGDIDIGAILVALLPKFAGFYTAVVPNVEIDPMPLVDDVNDIDDDPDTTKVPDYENFPELDMTLKVPMDQVMTINVGTLPQKGDGSYWYDGVIALCGVVAKEYGLIPLGLSAGLDAENKDDTPDGQVNPLTINCSDIAGRIPEGQIKRVVLVLGLNVSELMGGSGAFALSGIVKYVDAFTGTVDAGTFMPPPESVSYDGGSRTITVSGVPSATFHQVLFTGADQANWNVIGVFTDGDYTLPAAPASGDRADSASFISLKLADGVDYNGLLKFDENNMARLVELVESFSVYNP